MKKILLTLLLCFLIVVVAAGFWGYRYFFGVDDQLRTQLKEEFSQDFFSFNDLENELINNNIDNPEIVNAATPKEVISNKYTKKLEKLETTAAAKVDILFQSAYEEYLQQTANNQLNQTQLARKYLQAGNMLEESLEAIFNDLIREMETELKANNLPTDLVREVEKEYNDMIKEKKSIIMQQLEGHL